MAQTEGKEGSKRAYHQPVQKVNPIPERKEGRNLSDAKRRLKIKIPAREGKAPQQRVRRHWRKW